MDILFIETFYASIVLFICTFFYLRTQKKITMHIYKYILYMILIFSSIFLIPFLVYNITGYAFPEIYEYVEYTVFGVGSITGMIFILKKYFHSTNWFPQILFGVFVLSLYNVTLYIAMFTIILIFAPFKPL